MLEFAFNPDRTSNEPVYRQLGHYLRGLIAADRLPPGRKLPATRELATALALSRNTVSQAYEELVAEGLLSAHVGQGTFVAARDRWNSHDAGDAEATSGRSFVWSGLFALRARALEAPTSLLLRPRGAVRYDFRGGQVATDALPARDLSRAFGDAIRRRLGEIAAHQSPLGWPALRREIARYLVARGITCDPEDVAIVNGAQQAIDLVARVLLDPGDTVVMEQPGYFGASMAFQACQANLVGVGVDGDGMRVDEVARVLRARRAKLLYTTPAAQSPTGAVMSGARRRALLALADAHQVPIFEDDYDSELRYGGAPIAALKTLDGAGHQVIYTGTFSKVLFPALRVGYVVAARPLLQKLALARWTGDVGTSVLPQAALATLLEEGGLERHLRRVRRLYAERLEAMLAALGRTMPDGTSWTKPAGGHCVWLTLSPAADPDRLMRDALDAGIAYTRGDVFHFDGRGDDSLMLSFANLAPAAITDGITRLGALIRRAMTAPRKELA